jgi:hypothetical protein
MKYTEFVIRDLRLVLLRSLLDHKAYSANETILQMEAEAFGHSRSRDAIRAELRFLEEAGAILIKDAGSVLVATLTLRGQEHCWGRLVIDGVNQPPPGV